jgi:dihydrofolate reductase
MRGAGKAREPDRGGFDAHHHRVDDQLLRLGLLDELTLNTCPIVLGSGLRLFDDTIGEVRLELVESTAYGSGVLRAGYRRAGA